MSKKWIHFLSIIVKQHMGRSQWHMQENMFGEETEALRKSWKQLTATCLGKGYGQEGDVEANSVFSIYSIILIALRTVLKAFFCQRQKSLASRSISLSPYYSKILLLTCSFQSQLHKPSTTISLCYKGNRPSLWEIWAQGHQVI